MKDFKVTIVDEDGTEIVSEWIFDVDRASKAVDRFLDIAEDYDIDPEDVLEAIRCENFKKYGHSDYTEIVIQLD